MAWGRMRDGTGIPRAVSLCSAALRVECRARMVPWPRTGLRLGLASGEGPERGVGGQDSMKARQVQPRWRQHSDEAPHECLGRQGEGDSFLGRVLVAAIVEPAQA